MFKPFEQTSPSDDVLLVPQASKILPKDAILKTQLTKDITLNLPFLSSPHECRPSTRWQSRWHSLAAWAIHKNLSIDEQVEESKERVILKMGLSKTQDCLDRRSDCECSENS